MSKQSWNYALDAVLFALVVAIAIIGLLLGFVIPTGPAYGSGAKYLWGLHRHDWGALHLYFSIALLALLAVHLVLHWAWIKSCTQRLLQSPWALLAVLLAPLLLVGVGRATMERTRIRPREDVPAGASDRGGRGRPHRDGEHASVGSLVINGRTTLAEIERATGIAPRVLGEALGLPSDVDPDEQLGRLRRRYGFTIDKVRDIVEEFRSNGRQTTSP